MNEIITTPFVERPPRYVNIFSKKPKLKKKNISEVKANKSNDPKLTILDWKLKSQLMITLDICGNCWEWIFKKFYDASSLLLKIKE